MLPSIFRVIGITAGLFLTASTAFADGDHSVAIELCRADSSHVDIVVPAGTTLSHGPSGDARSYTVTLPTASTINSYADCLHTQAQTKSDETKAGDELHLLANDDNGLPINGSIFNAADSTHHKRKSAESRSFTDRTNWPN